MKTVSQTISLAAPLHGAMLAQPGQGETLDARIREREAASYERGRQDAERAAAELLRQERANFTRLRDGVLASLGEGVATVARDCEPALIELALAAACKLVAGLPIQEKQVAAVVREALAEIEDKAQIRVLLHPDDLALLDCHAGARDGAEAAEHLGHVFGFKQHGCASSCWNRYDAPVRAGRPVRTGPARR